MHSHGKSQHNYLQLGCGSERPRVSCLLRSLLRISRRYSHIRLHVHGTTHYTVTLTLLLKRPRILELACNELALPVHRIFLPMTIVDIIIIRRGQCPVPFSAPTHPLPRIYFTARCLREGPASLPHSIHQISEVSVATLVDYLIIIGLSRTEGLVRDRPFMLSEPYSVVHCLRPCLNELEVVLPK